MNKAFEKILERLDAKKQYFQKFYEADGKTEEDKYINKATQLAFDDAKNIVQEVAAEYNNGWIPCSDRLPEERDSIFVKLKGTDKWSDAMFEKISDDVIVTVKFEDGTRKTMTMHTTDGKWKQDFSIVKKEVIAWRSLPEPYKQKGEW